MLTDRPFNGKPESALLPKLRGAIIGLQSSSAPALSNVRFESTVPHDAVTESEVPLPLPPVSPLDPTATAKLEDSIEYASTSSSSPVLNPGDPEKLDAIASARASGNPDVVRSVVAELLSGEQQPSGTVCNAALVALANTWISGQSASYIVEAHDAFLARSVQPSSKTYMTLLVTLSERDRELFASMKTTQIEIKTLKACGLSESSVAKEGEGRYALCKAEYDTAPLVRLFRLASHSQFHPDVYADVLQSCAFRGNVDEALEVCKSYESHYKRFRPRIYQHLITAYSLAGDLKGAQTVFQEFRRASGAGQVQWHPHFIKEFSEQGAERARAFTQIHQIAIWNQMIKSHFNCGDLIGAIDLFEQMLDTPVGPDFRPKDIPPPAESTLSTIIRGFYDAGDIKTALVWFERLLSQSTSPKQPYATAGTPTRPGPRTWNFMFNALILENRIEDLNRLYRTFMALSQTDGLYVYSTRTSMIILANLHYLDSNPSLDADSRVAILDFLFDSVCIRSFSFLLDERLISMQTIYRNLFARYLDLARVDRALSVAETFFKQQLDIASSMPDGRTPPQDDRPLPSLVGELMDRFIALPSPTLPQLLRVASICNLLAVPQTSAFASRLVHVHADLEKQGLANDLTTEDLDVLRKAMHFCAELDSPGASSSDSVHTGSFTGSSRTAVADDLALPSDSASETVNYPPTYKTSVPEHHKPWYSVATATTAYEQLNADLQRGITPRVENVSRLIAWLGRLGELDKVRHLYQITQDILLGLEHSKERQSIGWFVVEDSMIVALAHAGEVDAAHVHRARILEQGGTPSADAYGALIHHVKDTTDDTSNAMALYQESQFRGVRCNLYLYNTIISKLAKARKADYAIHLFKEMKLKGVLPTSVTFGAVIAACCRVGDAESAERLFDEMIRQSNFKPRVPPFNTMMQLYTQTKPNRERALFYYNALLNAKVRPTAHTYKVCVLSLLAF